MQRPSARAILSVLSLFGVAIAILALTTLRTDCTERGDALGEKPLGEPGRGEPAGSDESASLAEVSTSEEAQQVASVDVREGDGRVALDQEPGGATAPSRRVQGRIVFPPRTPLDERPEVLVRVSPGGDELTVAPDEGGAFQFVLPREARSIRLDLASRYLYLDPPPRVEVEGLAEPVVLTPELGGALVVELVPPAGLESDFTGEDAEVRVDGWDDLLRTFEREAQAVDDGTYLVASLPTHLLWSLEARVEGLAAWERKGLRVRAGKDTPVRVSLARGVQLFGTVVAADGRPLSGARVFAKTRHATKMSFGWRGEEMVETQADGSFSLLGALPGEVRLEVLAEDHLAATQELGVLVEGEVRDLGAIALEQGGVVAGRVVWQDGSPAADVEVRVQRGSRSWRSAERTRTDAEGAFACQGLASGPYALVVKTRRVEGGSWWRAAVEEVPEGARGVELVLTPGDRVGGTVVDHAGVALERFIVRARPAGELGGRASGDVRQTFRKAGGVFELEGLDEGAWDLRAEARKHANGAWQRVRVPQETGPVRFVLPREASLRGTVVTPSGEPCTDGRAVVRPPGAKEKTAKLDEDGAFAFRGLVPGELDVTARGEGFQEALEQVVTLAPGEERAGLQLVLRDGARLTGELHASLLEERDREVTIVPMGTYDYRSTLCDEEGRFVFEGLAAGQWRVSFAWNASGGGGNDWVAGYQSRHEEQVTLVDGRTTHVVLGAPNPQAVGVSGLVTRAGEPVAEQLIYVFHADGASRMQPVTICVSDAGGGFELQLPAPGPYVFTVGDTQGDQVPFERTVTEDGEELQLELPTTVLGGVVLRADGSPAPRHPLMLMPASAPHDSRALGELHIVMTGADGSFRFEGIPDGTYRLRCGGWGQVTHGLGVQTFEDLVVRNGESREDLRFELAEAGVVTGQVLRADGRPAQGVEVRVVDPRGNPLVIWREVRTDHSGSFRFTDAGPGEHLVLATDEEGREARATVMVEPGYDVHTVVSF